MKIMFYVRLFLIRLKNVQGPVQSVLLFVRVSSQGRISERDWMDYKFRLMCTKVPLVKS